MIQETADTNIKDQLKFSIENETVELTGKPVQGKFYWDLERLSVDREKYLICLCSSSLKGRNGQFNNGSPRSSTQYALSSEEHHEATN